MNFSDFSFARPLFALFFLGSFLIYVLAYRFWMYLQKQKALFDKEGVLKSILTPRSKSLFWIKVSFLAFIWALLTLALMGPQGNYRYLEGEDGLKREPSSEKIIFLIDTSLSMSIEDLPKNESRLAFAKELTGQISKKFPMNPLGLYAFTSETLVVVPETFDHLFFDIRLEQLGEDAVDVEGTDLEKALKFVLEKKGGESSFEQGGVLVLLSDGGDRIFEKGDLQQKKQRLEGLDWVAKQLDLKNWKVLVLGIGSSQGGQIPRLSIQASTLENHKAPFLKETLWQISKSAKGAFFSTENGLIQKMVDDSIDWIEGAIKKGVKKQHVDLTPLPLIFDQYFQFPLGFACLFLLLFLKIPDVKKVSIVLFFMIGVLEAGGENQKLALAKNAMEAQEFWEAEWILKEKLTTPLKPFERAVFQYDLGFVLMKEKKFKEALEVFDQITLPKLAPFFWFEENRRKNLNYIYFNLAREEKEELLKLLYLDKIDLADADEKFATWVKEKKEELLQNWKKERLKDQNLSQSTDSAPVKVLVRALGALRASIYLYQEKKLQGSLQEKDIKELTLALELVLKEIAPFQKTSFDWQWEQLAKDVGLCQKYPWNQVFPAVFEGIDFIQSDVDQIKENGPLFQEKALRKWKEALDLLKDTKKQAPLQVQEQEELMRRIQEMEKMDQKKSATSVKMGQDW